MIVNENNLETNFTFETESASAVEDIPFRLLILGDWSGNSEKPDLSERRPIEIDRDNFNEVINQFNVSLELALLNDEMHNLRLTFENLDDFHPDIIFNQVSVFNKLRDLRKRLLNQKEYNSAVSELLAFSESDQAFDEQMPSAVQSNKTTNSTDLLDQILTQKAELKSVNLSQHTDETELSRFVGELVRPYLIKIDLEKQEQFIRAIDQSITNLMRKILHHKSFQNLESAWRGLNFLVMNTETDTNLKIYLFDITKIELTEHLKNSKNLIDSIFYQTIFRNDTQHSWTLLNADFSFDLNVDDAALLIRLAKISASNNVPFISYLSNNKSNILEDDTNELFLEFDETTLKLWTTLRSQPESEYIGLLITRFLARLPYGSDTEPLDNFDFEEYEPDGTFGNYLWANPCFVYSYLTAKTFSRFGWEIASNFIKEIDNMSAHIYKKNSETFFQSPLQNVLNLQEAEKVLELGLMPLISYKNSNTVRLVQSRSVSISEKPLFNR